MVSNLESDMISMERVTEYTSNPTEVRIAFLYGFYLVYMFIKFTFYMRVSYQNNMSHDM